MNNLIKDIDILEEENNETQQEDFKTLPNTNTGKKRKLYIESYGCQMNFSDSEIVASIMMENDFDTTDNADNADLIFLNTCAIRDNAEQRIRHRLQHLQGVKKKKPATVIGVLGCMAERLKTKLLEEEKIVDLVAGPDAYRDLPNLISEVDDGERAMNVFLSRDETYADIAPVRLNSNGVSAFVSIMRGCDNMCSFCVVPFTRGRERSRDAHSILKEVEDLVKQGYKEVTLLGQNVDSYLWSSNPDVISITAEKKAIKKGIDLTDIEVVNFAQLLEKVALVHPNLRVRFTTSHPKDMNDDVLEIMAKYDNIAKYIHLPAQSGNNRILEMMNRGYTREWYLDRIKAIRRILGDECGISHDLIAGFCSETEEEHQQTLSLMDEVQYDFGYMFFYSERPSTLAHKKYPDDITLEVKKRRLQEIIDKQNEHSLLRNQKDIGKIYEVLVEGESKRSADFLKGRNSQNKVVIFPKHNLKKGDYVRIKIDRCSLATLFGDVVE
ncbi:MAG: tRNA (N6-isopentenyl adenosine(37)-C2)-methylthiotransferase MiaB [Cytophagia bacterium]|nr:MAG: tRNA (N6-isopentenyl adenosine(37)-C2)-methylthiotransferase MiaB [Cytophagia bacterium]TAG38458.1 MAG: tRNA (N6-isopentenyl adenosine(37)-C2)-methylthiotransferase MiaB [Cytophagia bacterium]